MLLHLSVSMLSREREGGRKEGKEGEREKGEKEGDSEVRREGGREGKGTIKNGLAVKS